MATKKRKARGGELWAVIDTTTGDVASSISCGFTPIERSRKEAMLWIARDAWFGLDKGNSPGRYEVRKILWRFAPRGKRGN